MKDNIFKSGVHQDHDDTSFHDDAFQMIDTADTTTQPDHRPMTDNEEMLNTLNEMNRRTDEATCGCGNKPSSGRK